MSEEEIVNRLYTLSNEVLKVVGTKRIIVDKNIFLEAINLIKKQQKEIEEYKNVIDNREFTWKQKYEETFKYVKENYVSKDKIKEFIENETCPDTYNFKAIEVCKLKKLLEESE